VEQKYNEIHLPVYDKRNEIIKSILDSLSTAVSNLSSSLYFMGMQNMFAVIMLRHILFNFFVSNFVQFLSHHAGVNFWRKTIKRFGLCAYINNKVWVAPTSFLTFNQWAMPQGFFLSILLFRGRLVHLMLYYNVMLDSLNLWFM
jgi:hypothetical protein